MELLHALLPFDSGLRLSDRTTRKVKRIDETKELRTNLGLEVPQRELKKKEVRIASVRK